MARELIYTGIKHLDIGTEEEVPLTQGLSLVKPNPLLLSGRMRFAQNECEYEEAEKASYYLVYSYDPYPLESNEEESKSPKAMFYGGLRALQIVKPINTLGFVYKGTDFGGSTIHAAIEALPPMQAAEWARLKRFDSNCLREASALIPRVQAAISGTSVPNRNAITTLQLGLETYSYHHFIAGLLWVMGMEAIFDSRNRNDFSTKLCDLLGADTLVFPAWNNVPNSPPQTVQEIAIDLYMLRSKLAHAVDLRSAAIDRQNPVDLLRTVKLHEFSQERIYAELLAEAACYLLCQVIRKII
jgi:hypothetical protein